MVRKIVKCGRGLLHDPYPQDQVVCGYYPVEPCFYVIEKSLIVFERMLMFDHKMDKVC